MTCVDKFDDALKTTALLVCVVTSAKVLQVLPHKLQLFLIPERQMGWRPRVWGCRAVRLWGDGLLR